jgi:cell division protease FtsH
MQLPEKDHYVEGRKKLVGVLTGLMGGRAAEELVMSDITSGAASDLREATRIARLMICDWGMSEKLGPQAFGDNQELMFLGREINRTQNYSEETARRIDVEINALLTGCHDRALEILKEKKNLLEKIAGALLERETLDSLDVEDIVSLGRVRTDEEREKDASRKQQGPGAAAQAPNQPPPKE